MESTEPFPEVYRCENVVEKMIEYLKKKVEWIESTDTKSNPTLTVCDSHLVHYKCLDEMKEKCDEC